MKKITGLHHITAMASNPQKNLYFYAGILGLRLVKKTINFDATDVYHLYYGDESGFSGDQLVTGETFISTYSLRAPQKLNVGLSVFAGKSGFFSADIEWVDY